ncbi:F-box-like domain superfamily [Arabidopsis thaliana x Arabidopsis arenosa]|uniref:F-box-like domain superfamily n=1 Tax=Arabidopsis thaliana x Arabidopsis arenosa TaxID=1240361 RepID=A0A8T1Z2F4_9BRAS|nr:F-box-like domain superfamily [Arabidopsis thaliana x Arabidopsis arenosa]
MPGFDRISELPESLITQILLCLPTKDSVKTSVLSTRWKNLWLNVPGLDLNYRDFPKEDEEYEEVFINFIDRFLEFNPESRLQKFKVDYSKREILGFKDRIGTVINRGIRLLDAVSSTEYREDDGIMYPYFEFMPLNLFTSKTLVYLKLRYSALSDPGFVYMPCLKFMILREIRWSGTMSLEKLVSGCPVLEELTLVRTLASAIDDDELAVSRVRSGSLKTFYVPLAYGVCCSSRVQHTVLEIDAPGLENMILKEDHFEKIVVKNLTSLFMIDLDVKFAVNYDSSFDPEDLSKTNEIRDFLSGISRARHMIISHKTVKALDRFSKVGSIPKFNNLSRLQAEFPSPLLPILPAFLESFPNLKILILKIKFAKDDETEELNLVNVPRCFISTLECVEIKGLFEWEEEEMKIARYFLENSAVLKKLTLSFIDYPRYASNSDVYEELDKLTKSSRRCQIIVDDD